MWDWGDVDSSNGENVTSVQQKATVDSREECWIHCLFQPKHHYNSATYNHVHKWCFCNTNVSYIVHFRACCVYIHDV